jgi:DNA polymerase III subunit delta
MAYLNYEQILTDLKNRVFYPVYFLMGEEPYFIDIISDYIQEHVLPEEEKGFNQTILYGKDSNVNSIINAAKRYPLMSAHQVLIVKEAQTLDKIEQLESYVLNPLPSTVLVLCYKYKTVDKRKTFAKSLDKKAVVLESKKLYDNQIPAWIQKYVKERGYRIAPETAQILADSLGTDLSKIANELGKLFILLPPDSLIGPKEVEENIGISKDYNVFELSNALAARDIYKANLIIFYFAANPKSYPLIMVINSLFLFYRNLLLYLSLKDKSRNNAAAMLGIAPFLVSNYERAARVYNLRKVRESISLLREYDLKSKGVEAASTSQGELLKELIYFLLH